MGPSYFSMGFNPTREFNTMLSSRYQPIHGRTGFGVDFEQTVTDMADSTGIRVSPGSIGIECALSSGVSSAVNN